jgi:kinetochore protein Mis13/DSN1
VPQSPSPPPASKRQKTNPPIAGSSSNTLTYPPPTLPSLAASTSRSHSHVEGLNFHPAFTSRPRPSMPRLPSPERTISVPGLAPTWGSKSVMGPPEVFVRKTRKSMGVNQLPLEIRGDDELVPLPESETPMIRKNKELREAQSRRSSLGMRGQRSSSSLGRGDLSTYTPA